MINEENIGGAFNEDITLDKEFYINEPKFLTNRYHLQSFQKFARNFIGPNRPNKRLVVIAMTGTGKTLIGVLIAEEWRAWRETIPELKSDIYIIGPKVSIRRFIDELIDRGGNLANNKSIDTENIYISNEERARLLMLRRKIRDTQGASPVSAIQEYNKLNTLVRRRIEAKGYHFYSNQAFNNVKITPGMMDNSLIIVDEFHHLGNDNEYNKHYMEMVEMSKNLTQVGMTATIMNNEPEDIIGAFNIFRKKDEYIDASKVFSSKGKLAPEGLAYLMREIHGEYLYTSEKSIKYFPSYSFVGTIPKATATLEGKTYKIKDTYLVNIEMSENQYRAYINEYTGKMNKSTIKNIINMVLPMENGGYIINNAEAIIAASSPRFLAKNGIEFYKRAGETFVTGDILRLKNLAQWSTKYYMLIQYIVKLFGKSQDGHIYIFSSFVHNYGTKILSEILRMNGFYEYGSNEAFTDDLRHYQSGIRLSEWKKMGRDVATFIPATFLTYYSDYDEGTRQRLVEIFSSPDNKDFHTIKIFIGSDLTRESIHFNFIRHVFVVNYQDNFSRLQQIIGRAVRYNSHSLLPPDKRTVAIYQLVSAIPKRYYNGKVDLSAEQIEIAKNEESFIVITTIEKRMALEAINKGNQFRDEPPRVNMSYKLFMRDKEIFDAIQAIKWVFEHTVISDPLSLVKLIAAETDIIDDFILIAINKMIADKTIITSNNNKGYLIMKDNFILFQPLNMPMDISLNERLFSKTNYVEKDIPINDVLFELAEKQMEYEIKPEKLYRRVTANGLAQLEIALARLTPSEIIVIVEFAIREYSKSSDTKSLRPYVFNILKYFKRLLIDEKQLTSDFNNSNYDKYFDSLTFDKPDKNKLFIGHFVSKIPRIYNKKTDKFEEIDSEHVFAKKRKTKREMVLHPYIVGFLDRDNTGNIIFKLRWTEIRSTDKRKESRGFVCSQTNSKQKIIEIYKRLGIPVPKKFNDLKIKNICEDLEREMRFLQEKSIKTGENVQIFIDYNPWTNA